MSCSVRLPVQKLVMRLAATILAAWSRSLLFGDAIVESKDALPYYVLVP